MNEDLGEWYLFHNTPPIDMGTSPLLILRSPSGEIRDVLLADIAGFGSPLVTHSFALLVDWFRRASLPLPSRVIELELARKLLVGRPKSDFGKGNKPWDVSEILSPYLPEEYDQPKLRHALSTHLSRPCTGESGDQEWMRATVALLPSIWADLKKELNRTGEADRFFTIEIPVSNMMLISQLNGIRVDPHKRDVLLNHVEGEYLSVHHSLAIVHRIDVGRALYDSNYLLGLLGLSHKDEFEGLLPEEIIGQFKASDPTCASLNAILSAKRNKGILLRTFSLDSEFCHPVFDTMGTVTGRILAVDPQLQYLKREYRCLLAPRDGMTHLYVDYSQFEPNILASLSGDSTLLKLCCEGDIYTDLARSIFGQISARDAAKTLFLAYSYGMGKYGLTKLASRITDDISEASRLLEEHFFSSLAGIELWKQRVYASLEDDGRIGTSFGNFRNRTRKGSLSAREKRWSVSQVVQGTGALILKRVIQELARQIPEAQVLLPMHDALLVEVPSAHAVEITRGIVTTFIDTFVRTCPGTKPRVTIEPFAKGHLSPTMA